MPDSGNERNMLRIVNVFDVERPVVAIPDSVALGRALFCSGPFPADESARRAGEGFAGGLGYGDHLGVDMLMIHAGDAFPLHTHPGHHLLLVVRGAGTATLDGVVYATVPGDLYLIEAEIPHAVGAVEDHWLLSFGAPHKHLTDAARMEVMTNSEGGPSPSPGAQPHPSPAGDR